MSEPLPASAHRTVRWVFAAQLALLAIAAWRNAHQLNTDAVAYLRLAHYYANGQTELGISGYWSPMFVWLLVPGLKCGLAPLITARVVMMLSAAVFFWGGITVLRAFRLPDKELILGACLLACASIAWSVRAISPDLLVAGLFCFAVAAVLDARWLKEERFAALAGCSWGLAYLAKAVAFPLAVIVGLPLALLVGAESGSRRQALRQLGVTLAAAFVVAMPWMVTISLKHQKATFSTTARIAHAVAGPADVDRYHPFARTFHQPEPGRVTAWEDPSRMSYRYWSPFDSAANFRHQVDLMTGNFLNELSILGGVNPAGLAEFAARPGALSAARALAGLDLCWLGVLALGVSLWIPALRGGALVRERWRWAAVPCLGVMALYLPVFLMREDQRYFYGLLPFLWVATAGVAGGWRNRRGLDAAPPGQRTLLLCFASFMVPALLWCAASLRGLPNAASREATGLAAGMRAAKLSGAIAGHALLQGGRAGLYTAWLLGQPWHGEASDATPRGFRDSGARFAIVVRDSALDRALASDASLRNLDTGIFGTPGPGASRLRVYEIAPAGAALSPAVRNVR